MALAVVAMTATFNACGDDDDDDDNSSTNASIVGRWFCTLEEEVGDFDEDSDHGGTRDATEDEEYLVIESGGSFYWLEEGVKSSVGTWRVDGDYLYLSRDYNTDKYKITTLNKTTLVLLYNYGDWVRYTTYKRQ
ncbi:MAG: lipocalin family protein [Bacteroidales bacterium]|nr:lipocalin family protein [Bacteroidales bacterium]